MKVSIVAGGVSLVVDGCDWTRRQVRAMLFDVAGLSATLDASNPPTTVEVPSVGFTAHLERAPDEPTVTYYDDEE